MKLKSSKAISYVLFGSLILSSCNSDTTYSNGVNIKLSCTPSKADIEQTAQCTARVVDFNGTPIRNQPVIKFTSNNPDIATIDPATGVIVAHSPGVAIISASSGDYTARHFEFTVAWAKAQIQIFDAQTSADLSGVSISVCTLPGNCQSVKTTENPEGNYTLLLTPKKYSLIRISKAGYQTAEYVNPQVFADRLVVLNQISLLPETTTGNFHVSGHVVNAINGQPVVNSIVNIRLKINNTNEENLITTTTDSSGKYQIEIPAGYYTLSGTADHFTNATTSFTAKTDGQELGDLILNPSVENNGIWRIILDWGLEPQDLDAHFTGPTANSSRFNIFYSQKAFSDSQTNVNLDVDDTSSYGPETITLSKANTGLYRYSVHDFTNRGKGTSEALRKSNARVRVYQGNSLMGTFYVPSGKGDVWKVFTLDLSSPNSPVLLPDNRFTTIGNPSSIP